MRIIIIIVSDTDAHDTCFGNQARVHCVHHIYSLYIYNMNRVILSLTMQKNMKKMKNGAWINQFVS